MCFSDPPPPPPPPAPPPPPPPVLEQAAPETAAPTQGDNLNRRAMGTKKYRNSLGIQSGNTSAGSGSTSTGLGIPT